ncbi:MAG: hypothetical protein HKN29_04910 [Rhodothermales bacterium]|nr:hypothetical protein [Rhodothermales bacterium]
MSPTLTLFAIALNLFALAACVWIIVSLSDRQYPTDPSRPRRNPARHRAGLARQ